MTSTVFSKIKEFLDQHNIEYKHIEHPPTYTSEESAKYRNEPIKIGAKAILLKMGDQFALAVLPADRKLDTKKLKKHYGTKRCRFATKEELFELTGLEPGSVPPFGNLMNLPMVVDTSLFEKEVMAFNAGSLTNSLKMKTKDYREVVKPEVLEFSS